MITLNKLPHTVKKYVYFMNIGIDNQWESYRPLLPQFEQSDNKGTINCTEQLCYLLARRNDIVIQRQPLPSFLQDSISAVKQFIPKCWIPISSNINQEVNITELILNDPEIIEQLSNKNKLANNDRIHMP